MGTGNAHQRTTGGLAHFQHVHTDHGTFDVLLTGDLLAGTQHSVRSVVTLTDADKDIAIRILTQDGSGQQFLRLVGIGFVHHAALCLTDALNDHLLGGLGSDAAKLCDVHGDGHGFAQTGVHIIIACGIQLDFQSHIFHFCHNGLDKIHGQALLGQVHDHIISGNIPMIFTILAVSIGQRLLQTLHHVGHGDALELLQILQAGKNFSADINLGCFGSLLGSSGLCHCRFVPPISIGWVLD